MKSMSPEELKKFLHQQLRSLPVRQAPRSLEARVMAAIEQQPISAWYHKSWSHWPIAIRAVFLSMVIGITYAFIVVFSSILNAVETSTLAAKLALHFEGLLKIYNIISRITGLMCDMINSIPLQWLYGGMLFVIFIYAAFFGLSAIAYRTLYHEN